MLKHKENKVCSLTPKILIGEQRHTSHEVVEEAFFEMIVFYTLVKR